MKTYNNIVVGSGISGLTLALLLGMNGHKVLLLEKNLHIGGSLTRFYKEKIPLDKGFHFTGGLLKNEILFDMLKVLGINDFIEPVFFSHDENNQILFESEQLIYDLPSGINNLSQKLKDYFPNDLLAIDQYFNMVERVCAQAVTYDLRKIFTPFNTIDEDYVSLDEVLGKLTNNQILKAILSAYCMLYGVKPAEISFANHARACINLYKSLCRVKNGGEAFITAFKERFTQFDIEIMTGSYITELIDINEDNEVGRFVLNSGAEISCDQCIFTIHPKEILKILPQKKLSKAFTNRVSAFEHSAGFFSLVGTVHSKNQTKEQEPTMHTLLPSTDLNRMIDSKYSGLSPLIIIKNHEPTMEDSSLLVNAFEPSFFEHVAAWKDSNPKKRPFDYLLYKQQRSDSMIERINQFYPEHNGSFKLCETASMLTYRDYLHTPVGSAYGIKQKIGQYNLFGKLPLRNIYVAGQSSIMPGLIGAMISSFIIGRALINKEKYLRFIGDRLCS